MDYADQFPAESQLKVSGHTVTLTFQEMVSAGYLTHVEALPEGAKLTLSREPGQAIGGASTLTVKLQLPDDFKEGVLALVRKRPWLEGATAQHCRIQLVA